MGKLSLTSEQFRPNTPYATDLGDKEPVFRQFLQQAALAHPAFAAFNPDDPRSDYDMRGWWQAAIDPTHPQHELTGMSASSNSIEPHFDDYWKTPYHPGFSADSIKYGPGANTWKDDGYGGWNLTSPSGSVVKAEPDRKLRITLPEDDQ